MITEPHKFGPYEPKTVPYDHQRADYELSRDMEYFGYLWEMGTGKSKPILDTAMYLFHKKEIDGLLIVSDKGCYMNWPLDQIPDHLDTQHIRVAHWSAHMSREEQFRVNKILTAHDDKLDILCINVESLVYQRGYAFAEQFLRGHWPMMAVDESTSIKNIKAKRTQACIQLGQLAQYRRIASGTPITNGPLDLFAQCEFLKPGVLGFKSFVAFKHNYAIVRFRDLGKVKYEEILGYQNMEDLSRKIQKFTSRRLKSECLTLPEKVYEKRYVEQTAEQREAYRKLKEEALLLIDGGMVTITNALTLLGKLHQINCGHIKDDDGTIRRIPSNRIDALLELRDNIPGKVVIWSYFKEDVRIICEAIRKVRGPTSCVDYYGDTNSEDRIEAVARFRDDPSCTDFVGTPKTGGKGLNGLTVACDAIYYSNGFMLEPRLQSEDRIHRIGQRNICTYYDLLCRGTVDVTVLRALQDKRNIATEVLDTIRQMISFDTDNLVFDV